MFLKNQKLDKEYDVIVVGFGGAGANAARFAADKGVKVLLVDSAPQGHEGGNTRYCAGMFATGKNFDDLKEYYSQTYAPFSENETLNTFIENIITLKDDNKKYFGIEPTTTTWAANGHGEYPEFSKSDAMKLYKITPNLYDGSFWKILRAEVYKRLDKIDIWYETPAVHLIQDPYTKVILGVQVKRNGKLRNIAANKGVVLSLGGFENNQEMVQTYLGEGSLAPIGTLYNKGQGINLAIEVGAKLWHMSNYDSHGFSLKNGDDREKFSYMISWKSLFNGSIFVAGDDGTRYFKEDEEDRHGYKYNHGDWRVPQNQNHPHIILDQKQFEKLQHDVSPEASQIKELLSYAIKADSIEELGKMIKANKLAQAVDDFNFMIDLKRDIFLNRSIETMVKFTDGTVYAIPIRHNILHTHGGAERNGKAQVLDLNGNVIPHLYEAGELGDPFATKYLGGDSVADLLISGRIAGINVASEEDLNLDAVTSASVDDLNSDAKQIMQNYDTSENQYIGESTIGIGDTPLVVRVTVDDDNSLKQIEVLQQAETEGIGGKAIPKLIERMIDQNTSDVDAVSGATSTSRGLKQAVKRALDKMQ